MSTREHPVDRRARAEYNEADAKWQAHKKICVPCRDATACVRGVALRKTVLEKYRQLARLEDP